MKKFFLFTVLAAFVLSSCSNDDNVQNAEQSGNTIKFGTYVRKGTKAVTTTNASFTAFQVRGYTSSTAFDWATGAPTLLMEAGVSRLDGGTDESWATTPVNWPTAGDLVQFFGFAPNSGNIVYSATSPNGPVITYTNTASMEDVLVAKSNEITTAAANHQRVPMPFSHALAKISFSAKVPAGATVYISAVSIEGLKSVGAYNFFTGIWGNLSAPLALDLGVSSVGTSGVTSTSGVNITATDGAIIAIPQIAAAWTVPGAFDADTQCRLKIVYSLKANSTGQFILGTGSTSAAQLTAYLPMGMTFENNHSYMITLAFGDGASTSGGGGYDNNGDPVVNTNTIIKFSTTFTDWTDAPGSTTSM